MKKADGFLIAAIMLISILLVIPLFNADQKAQRAAVYILNKEIMQIDLSHDDTYTVEGTLGDVSIEVKDGKVRVSQENSPHHYCSKQGFVSSVNTPIVCLPNDTVVKIEGEDNEEDTVIQ